MSGDSALLGRRLILLTCTSLFTGSGSRLAIHAQLPSLFVSDGVPQIHAAMLRLMCRGLIQGTLGTSTREGKGRTGKKRGGQRGFWAAVQVDPTGRSGAGKTLLSCPKLGQHGQPFMSPH